MTRYSIVITTHRRPGLLPRAIRSVQAQGTAPQIVLVSDAPCEDTARLAATLLGGTDIYIQRGGAPGPAASRNMGLQVAEADFVVFLDDDDALSPDFLASAEPHATDDAVLYVDLFTVVERVGPDGPVPLSGERRSLGATAVECVHVKNFIPQPCLIFPMAAVRQRRFDPTLVLNEDWDFILNACTDLPLRHVPIDGPVVYTREQADNRGRRNDHLLADTYRRIYRRWPAPTLALKQARQAFFASVGLAAALEDV